MRPQHSLEVVGSILQEDGAEDDTEVEPAEAPLDTKAARKAAKKQDKNDRREAVSPKGLGFHCPATVRWLTTRRGGWGGSHGSLAMRSPLLRCSAPPAQAARASTLSLRPVVYLSGLSRALTWKHGNAVERVFGTTRAHRRGGWQAEDVKDVKEGRAAKYEEKRRAKDEEREAVERQAVRRPFPSHG
jgi:hypothetical protein